MTGETGTKQRGLVCRICDRKFMLYVRYQDYAADISMKDQLILENQRQLTKLNRDFTEKSQRIANI